MLHRFLLLAGVIVGPAVAAADQLTFEKDVRPILKAHCFLCHGESGVTEGSLDLRLRHFITSGGDSGGAIDPGDAENSLLLQRVRSGEMPPEDKQLAAKEIEILRQWIEQGAKTARPEPNSLDDGEYISDEERNFWSFQPIRRPSPPKIDGARNPVDAFILRRLQQDGLTFSPPADRATLIRRATFDLWGLPPEPRMVDAFVADSDPSAYVKLIDRLLADPRYGERWGRHWLDVAGYADSEGYTNQDSEREFAYFYRDYVIRSFNDGKPLDQFVCEQLAGDEMHHEADASELSPRRIEQLTATGFLRMAPDGTASGGIDRAVAANETIADTINIVSTSLLGLTIGCARCHDHRYDPISQADYYRFRAIFEPALDWKQWKVPNARRVSMYTAADREAREQVEAKAKEAETARTRRQQEHIARTLYEELLVAPDDKRPALKAAFETEKSKRTPEQIALLEEHPSIGNISPGSLYLYAEQRGRRAGDIEKAAQQREARYFRQVSEQLLEQVAEEKRESVRQALKLDEQNRNDAQKTLLAEITGGLSPLALIEKHDPQGFAELKRYRQAAEVCRQQDAKTELAKMQEQITAIRKTAPKENFIRALTEPPGHTPPTHLFIRGDQNQLGKQVVAAELQVLTSFASTEIPENNSALASSGRRLAYARHLTSGQHPLLARVLANRIWLQHFGRGIVESPGDLGMLGARPTHPELLDWLADELMRLDWQLKSLHRTMMLSRTYQQRSARTPQLDQFDPDNRLYARMSVRRLESESMRDAVLAASGFLIDQMYGPPVPVKEDAVGQIVLGKEELDGERKPKADNKEFAGAARRSLYVQVRRTRPLAVLETFDIATMTPNCTQRNASNVATQALMMMNSQFVIDHAEKMAAELISGGGDLPAQLKAAWKRCFSRDVDGDSLSQLVQFVHRQTEMIAAREQELTPAAARQRALASACQALLSSNQFLYVD